MFTTSSTLTGHRWIAHVLFLVLAMVPCGGCAPDAPVLRLATTTSTVNSGLMEALLPVFEEQTGIQVQVVTAGTGQALELGRRGDVDVILVHAREREDAFVRDGHGSDRRDVMWNDFVVCGPAADPARIRGATDLAVVRDRILASGGRFVSRGDESGTHTREQSLWGPPPAKPGAGYISAGQGMGKCLLLADEKQAYVLTDRGTFLAFFDRIELEVLVEGDPSLKNPYGVILVNPARHDVAKEEAERFRDFLLSDRAKDVIRDFRVNGEMLFHPADEGH